VAAWERSTWPAKLVLHKESIGLSNAPQSSVRAPFEIGFDWVCLGLNWVCFAAWGGEIGFDWL